MISHWVHGTVREACALVRGHIISAFIYMMSGRPLLLLAAA